MANVNYLGSYGDSSNSSLMFRNKLINGGFDIWQRGTSQNTDGYGSDDRWYNGQSGSAKLTSQEVFTPGQTNVPGSPRYFSRTVVTSVTGSSNFVTKSQAIEGVRTFAGQVATLSFWAKADSTKNIACEFVQNFGTGGSPSAAISLPGGQVTLTSSWKYFTSNVFIPSISGKTLGTNNNDYLMLKFWFDAGSLFSGRTGGLGQQSGTFDLANVQLEAGAVATPFEYRPIGTELTLCQRYCERMDNASGKAGSNFCWGLASSTTNVNFIMPFAVPKRSVPDVTNFKYSGAATFQAANGVSGYSISAINYSDTTSTTTCAGFGATTSGVTQYQTYYLQTVNGQTPYLIFSAEL